MHNLSANLEHSEGSVLITKLFFFYPYTTFRLRKLYND